MQLTTAQLCFLRCLESRDFEANLLDAVLLRCGATTQEHASLEIAGLVATRRGRVALTDAGKTHYKRAKVGRHF